MKFSYIMLGLLIISVVFISGCTKGEVQCSADGKQCEDGSYVFREPPSCEFTSCPDGSIPNGNNHEDTNNVTDDKKCDPEIVGVDGACTLEYMPVCGQDGNTYGNACQACRAGQDDYTEGECEPVACPEDAKICEDGTTVVRVPPECDFAPCPEPEPEPDEEVYCQADDIEVGACIEIYQPVCGWFDPEQIQCVKEPCASTYANSCFACMDEKVLYYTEGQCPA